MKTLTYAQLEETIDSTPRVADSDLCLTVEALTDHLDALGPKVSQMRDRGIRDDELCNEVQVASRAYYKAKRELTKALIAELEWDIELMDLVIANPLTTETELSELKMFREQHIEQIVEAKQVQKRLGFEVQFQTAKSKKRGRKGFGD